MLRGTQVLTGEEAKRYVDATNKLRGCLHRG